jgi:hypothetical protein
MKKLLLVLLFASPVFMQAQFKVIMWYESFCEKPLGEYYGIGISPWEMDFTGMGVVVHFDNGNVGTSSPYWGYIAGVTGAEVDSVYFFYGQNAYSDNPQKSYPDSLEKYAHAAGAAVAIEIQAVSGTSGNLYTIVGDSTKTDVFCTTVAQWAERHGYDGVDVNWELNLQNTTNGTRFVRILRRKLTQYLTTPVNVSRPWLSLTCPPGTYSSGSCFPSSIKDSVDMICPQHGIVGWVTGCGGLTGSNINWYGSAITVGPDISGDGWLAAFADQATVITNGTWGIRGVAEQGWPKSMIAPAFNLGGGIIFLGNTTPLGCSAEYSYKVDKTRYAMKILAANGGTWHWDNNHQASYLSGTTTADLSAWPLTIGNGVQFFAPTVDSTGAYTIARWLINDGWGGVAPYSVAFDVDYTLSKNDRLPGHKGLVAAADSGSSPPAATGRKVLLIK